MASDRFTRRKRIARRLIGTFQRSKKSKSFLLSRRFQRASSPARARFLSIVSNRKRSRRSLAVSSVASYRVY